MSVSKSGLVTLASLAIAVCVSSWTTARSQADTVNVQFEGTGVFTPQQGSFSGNQGVYTGDGIAAPVWNVLSEPAGATSDSMSNLVTSGGLATSVGVSFTATGTYGDPTNPSNALLGGALLASGNHTGTVTLTGLTDSGNYTLYIYGQNASYNSDITTYSITTGTGSPASGQFDNTVDGGSTSGIFYNNATNNNYTIFDATANATGVLTVSFTGGAGEGVFNGVQVVGVTPVPEPAAVGILAIGSGITMLLLRRRRVA